jgi:hypothetical protein
MANKVQLKRSAVPGKVPATTDIDLGEIAINTYDGLAYIKKNVGGVESVVPLGGGSGSGDVIGPSVATDNAIARFDGASGKFIKNSTATLDDSGNASMASLSLTTDLAVTHGGTGASDAAGARTNLGLGSLATLSSINDSNWSGTPLAIANGGTGAATRQDAMDALAGAVTAGQYLRGNGTDVVMSAIQASDVPTLNQNTTGTASNVTGTVAIANGGTGATTAASARTNLGLGELAVLNNVGTTQITNGAVTFEKLLATDWERSLGTSGMARIAGGLLVQWGRVASLNGGATTTVTFPIAFPSACTGVQTCVNTSGDINEIVQAYSQSTTQVTLRNSNPGTLAVFWLAYGY